MTKRFSFLMVFMVLATAPLTVQAENINIYGWQNWSYEWISADGAGDDPDRDVDRLSANGANIGFISHLETGIPGLQVGFRCEQFTYWGRRNDVTGWCNRDSKLSLRHETLGEIMFGHWLLPFNEIVAQWVDPFYDVGVESHASIMGNLGLGGAESEFFNGSFDLSEVHKSYGVWTFNARQQGIVQYVWPNTTEMNSQTREGLQFRFAILQGSGTDVDRERINRPDADPRLWTAGVSYQRDIMGGNQVWLAAAYEIHYDFWSIDGWIADGFNCDDSDDDALRFAGRYVHNWGDGMTTHISAMYEELDFEADGCSVTGGMPEMGASAPLSGGPRIGGGPYTFLNPGNGVTSSPKDMGIERDAWLVSGKHIFGNGFDVRFSYMNAGEWECRSGNPCDAVVNGARVYEENTDAEAYNIGLFYTLPAGTELRVTYSKIDNDSQANYNFGHNPAEGLGAGEDVEAIAVGIVHWFD